MCCIYPKRQRFQRFRFFFQIWKLDKRQVFLDSCLGSGLRPLFYHLRRTLSLIVKSEFISGWIYLRKLDDCCCKSVYITLRHFLKSLGEIFGRQIDQESFWSGKVATIGFGEGIQSGHRTRSPDRKIPHSCKKKNSAKYKHKIRNTKYKRNPKWPPNVISRRKNTAQLQKNN